MKNIRKGFTLIELLVVIAIIGILSAVVLASLNNARDKGSNAAIKSTVNNARAQAELYYDSNLQSYGAVCNNGALAGGVKGIYDMKLGASNAGGGVIGTDVKCAVSSTGDAWALESKLKGTPTTYYCVDSTGNATTTTATGIGDGTLGAGPAITANAICSPII
ncbi:type II secretion system GspH family protein [Candidatus Parcubacteria bacterium]|nr:type II secretion system GspH family protein [Candidatus Parcubacteria bacterium]